jgi:hypothetical protein
MSHEASQRRAELLVRTYLYEDEADFQMVVQQCIAERRQELNSGAVVIESEGNTGTVPFAYAAAPG